MTEEIGSEPAPAVSAEELVFRVGSVRLAGTLTVPEEACGSVVFVHGSGSSRLSPRNRQVARDLNAARLATLLFDLLTPEEEGDRGLVFDIAMLAGRLRATSEWLCNVSAVRDLALGYFGASTGAAAALWVAADPESKVRAVVSRGGRPDLAGDRLRLVRAPTLLVVGGHDPKVLDLNRQARERLPNGSHLVVVPGATHLFDEPGALDRVSALARDWFLGHLGPRVGPA